ncbi:hypothetical protein COCNU_03G012630 [Cocos nucifera]|uniref:Myb/SANT-like domain-containing protein n=1 Tax=Cocos nucifera TaxID=13894 RepID=A0A8K0MZ72_COCNU|nr:hypothetical protein COCNU_03G012630 [Cocos nucifera]
MIANKIPNCGIKAQPYIQSRFKLLKQQYSAIYDILNTSGFGWDGARKCIICDQDVWDNWVKSHPQASNLRNKPFLHLLELSIIFRKDRAMDQRAEDPTDAAAKILTDVINSEEEVQFIDPTGFESNFGIMCQASSKGIDKLADCFQFLIDDQELKKKVYEAIVEIEDLELHESLMVKAGLLIARDSASLTYFFSLPQRLRKYHVLDVLGLEHG